MSDSIPPRMQPGDRWPSNGDWVDRSRPPHAGPSPGMPERKPLSRCGLVSAFAFLIVVMITAVSVILVVGKYREQNRKTYLGSRPSDSRAAFVEKTKSAFSAKPVELTTPELRRIRQAVLELGRSIQDREFDRTQIDARRYIREVIRWRRSETLVYENRNDHDELIRSYFSPPQEFDSIRIQKIDRLAEGELEVFCYVWKNEPLDFSRFSSHQCFRFWMQEKSDGQWKIYDWQEVFYGLRDSFVTAVTIDSSEKNNRIRTSYQRMVDASEQLAIENSSVAATKTLEAIEKDADQTPLREKFRVELSNQWWNGKHYEKSRDLACSAKPQLTPGALYRKAMCELYLLEYDEAINTAEEYESIFGPHPAIGELIAYCLVALQEWEGAEAKSLQILERFPESRTTLTFLAMCPGNEAKVIEKLDEAPGFELALPPFVNAIQKHSDERAIEVLERLAQFLDESDGKQEQLDQIDRIREGLLRKLD